MTNSEQAIREFAEGIMKSHETWGKPWNAEMREEGIEEIMEITTALISEHYVSKEGYIALENMLAKTEAALMEQKQLYFKLFEEEINCMYCEAKIRRGSAIILCKECAEDNF